MVNLGVCTAGRSESLLSGPGSRHTADRSADKNRCGSLCCSRCHATSALELNNLALHQQSNQLLQCFPIQQGFYRVIKHDRNHKQNGRRAQLCKRWCCDDGIKTKSIKAMSLAKSDIYVSEHCHKTHDLLSACTQSIIAFARNKQGGFWLVWPSRQNNLCKWIRIWLRVLVSHSCCSQAWRVAWSKVKRSKLIHRLFSC